MYQSKKPHIYTFKHNFRKPFDMCVNVRKYENYQKLRKRYHWYHSFPRYDTIIKGLKNEGWKIDRSPKFQPLST